VTLREERVYFTNLVATLLTAISHKTWPYKVEVAIDEWTVHSDRIYTDRATGERRLGVDRIHNPKGYHPKGLAVDFLIYVDGKYVSDGGHPIWRDLDEMAHGLDSRLNFGDEFHDSNHLSLGELS
jgi:hypothetical protein